MDQADLDKLFDTAIGREKEAYKFYKDVAERVSNPAVKELFDKLAAEEQGHEEALWKFKSDPSAPMKFKAPPDYKVAETGERPEITADMKPADAIALAMKKEQQAVEFYQQLADWCTDSALAAQYENLAKMELNHKHKLENLFVDIGYPEVW